MNSINFKANFLKKVYLPQISKGKLSEKEVSIVELDNKDKRDLNTLAKTACDWENYASGYAFEIFNDAQKIKPYPDVSKEHYLALTTQNCDYANLNSDKILGLALFQEKKTVYDEIAWLQANPKTNHECQNRKYSGIGKSLVSFIKSLTCKPIIVSSDDNAVIFYEKQGFNATGKYPSQMIYRGKCMDNKI